MSPPRYVDCVFNAPLPRPFTYEVPADWAAPPAAGARVYAPLGARRVTGLVTAWREALPEGQDPASVKPLIEALDEAPVLDEALLGLVAWVADYYHAPPGMAAFTALPPGTARRDEVRLRLAHPDLPLPRELPAWLRRLGRGSVTPSALRKEEGFSPSALERLIDAGLIIKERVERRPDARARTEQVIHWLGGDLDTLRGARQRQVAERLAASGSVTMTELRAEVGAATRGAVDGLVKRGMLRLEEARVFREPFDDEAAEPDTSHTLTPAQARVVTDISAQLEAGFSVHLIHGITGSGKTEVYLRLIRQVLDAGRGALVLVPEIALTPQLAARFKARFGADVAVLHSALSPGERLDQWDRIRAGAAPVVVGARSAVFAPLPDPGIIVIDEEHDTSYKQGDGVRYHARDVALVRGQRQGVPVVLGSATPSLESLSNAWRLKSTLHSLPERPSGVPMPRVEVIDLRAAELVEGAPFLSTDLLDEIRDTVKRGRQVILYHNRRGHSPYQLCPACGHVPECRACAISLTYHRHGERLICHTCGASRRFVPRCELCGSDAVELRGVGTEQLEETLARLLPQAPVLRFDADSVGARGHARLLAGFRCGDYPIMVGTQMVTKGHDFPGVHLVGVLMAEHGLRFPDLRAAEHTVQRLVQVAGRAGRAGEKGLVMVQTYAPDHYAMGFLSTHDYLSFARRELQLREERGFPPAGYLALLEARGPNPILVERDLARLRDALDRVIAARGWPGFRLRGPTLAPLKRVKGRARFHLLVAHESRPAIRALLGELEHLSERPAPLFVDVDPQDFM
jgi:primosomal protein N' (replication factor Y) (superfamily II helicase)